jgi:ArsR family transcriptional regulator, arsenate/arsenite/antimonite-responsive transcriptional repressor
MSHLFDDELRRDDAERLAQVFQALAEPNRLRILNRLAHGPMTAADLTAALGVDQSVMSHHLRKLGNAGLIERQFGGRRVPRRLQPDAFAQLATVITPESTL